MRDNLRLVAATLGSLLLIFLVFGELATALGQPRWLNWHLTLPVVVVAASIAFVTLSLRRWAREPVPDCRCGDTHSWVGCYCSKCFDIRSEGHDLDGCVCRACKCEFHVWGDGYTCSKCGATRDEVYPPGKCYTCDVWRPRAFEDIEPPFTIRDGGRPRSVDDFVTRFVLLGHTYHAAGRDEDSAMKQEVLEEALVLKAQADASGVWDACLRELCGLIRLPGYGMRALRLVAAVRAHASSAAVDQDAVPTEPH